MTIKGRKSVQLLSAGDIIHRVLPDKGYYEIIKVEYDPEHYKENLYFFIGFTVNEFCIKNMFEGRYEEINIYTKES